MDTIKKQVGRPKGTPKTGGRKRGTPNKVTQDLREWVSSLIDRNRLQVENDLKNLEPKDRLQILEKLMSYVLPKLQSVDQKINFDQLTDEQIDHIINNISDETGSL